MGKRLFIGNLPYGATEQILHDAFSECGTVQSAEVVVDRATGYSKGFAFVEMATDAEAVQAIQKFHGADYDGRTLIVSEAKPQPARGMGMGMGRGPGQRPGGPIPPGRRN